MLGRSPRPGVLVAAALAVVAAAYSNAVDGPFVWDDRMLIVNESRVHSLEHVASHFGSVFWAKSASYEANPVYYRPVVTLSYALDWVRSGGDSGAFHVTNVLLHLLVCGLVYLVARRLGAASVAAAMAAALFGVAPRLTESVAWISGRTDVFAAVFALGALLVHDTAPDAHARRLGAAALVLLGLFSKEVAIAVVAPLVFLEARRDGPANLRRLATNLAPAIAAVVVYAALRLHATSQTVPQPEVELPLATRLAAPVQALGAYGLMLLDPLRPRLQIGVLRQVSMGLVAAGAVATAALGFLVVRGRARWRAEVWAGLAFAGAAIALVLHVAPIRVNVVAADRFLYLPLAGLAVALAVGAGTLAGGVARAALAASLIAIPVFAAATYHRNLDWRDEARLWRVAAETTPAENVLPRFELANVLQREWKLEQALRLVEEALPIVSRGERGGMLSNVAFSNIAALRSELGEYDVAAEMLARLIAAEPGLALHRYNLGVVEARRLRLEDAARELRRALELMPSYGDAARALAVVEDARREIASLDADGGAGTATDARRARVWERLGRIREAEALWAEVLDSPDATVEDLRAGVAFLSTRGSRPAAERAIARAFALRIAPPQVLDELQRASERRFAPEL